MHNFHWKATWNIPLGGWFPSKNLFCGAEQLEGGGKEGVKTWRESLIPDDNAIRINRRSARRPRDFDYSRGDYSINR